MTAAAVSTTFEMLGVPLLFETDDRLGARWLESFLRPWFSSADPAACRYTARLVHDEGRFAELEAASRVARLAPVECFCLDSQVIAHPGWRMDGATCVSDRVCGCFYLHTGSGTTVVARPGDRRPRLAVVRILRELTAASLSSPRLLSLHAAAVGIGGQAVVLAGPKQVGKTTLLSYLLLTGPGTLISNDWVFVSFGGPDGDGPDGHRPTAYGMPTVVKVRRDSLGLFPSLAAGLLEGGSFLLHPDEGLGGAGWEPSANRDPDCHYLSPRQFAARLGAEAVGSAPLAAIVFPHFASDVHTLALRRLDASSGLERLRTCQYGRRNGRRGSTLFGGVDRPSEAGLEDLAQRVPLFECFLGPLAYQGDAAAKVLLDALPAGLDRR